MGTLRYLYLPLQGIVLKSCLQAGFIIHWVCKKSFVSIYFGITSWLCSGLWVISSRVGTFVVFSDGLPCLGPLDPDKYADLHLVSQDKVMELTHSVGSVTLVDDSFVLPFGPIPFLLFPDIQLELSSWHVDWVEH